MTTIDSLQRVLDVQLQTWNDRAAEKKSNREPVITITREPGCDGEAIAQTIAKAFQLNLYDWNLVELIAKDAHVSKQVVATLDEKPSSELDDWLDGFAGGNSLPSYKYMQSLRKVLFTIATHGKAVILGRGANFLLPAEKRTLGICLVAQRDVRVKNVMQKFHLSQKEARKHIVTTEREHRLFVKRLGYEDMTDPTHYHLVINTALVAPKTIVQIVKGFIGTVS
jgi:hypothetical protein